MKSIFEDKTVAETVLDRPRNNATERLDSLWDQFREYCDRDFCREFNQGIRQLADSKIGTPEYANALRRLQQRYWEMLCGCMLLRHGFNVVRTASRDPDGPDFLVKFGDQIVWIECICPGPGNTASGDHVVEAPVSSTKIAHIPADKITLRLSAAYVEKSRKFADYRAIGTVSDSDFCIVAVNSRNIGPDVLGLGQSLINNYLFAHGQPFVEFDTSNTSPPKFGISARRSIKKHNGSGVPAGPFTSDSDAYISGVLYSESGMFRGASLVRDSSVLVLNPHATTELPKNFCNRFSRFFTTQERTKGQLDFAPSQYPDRQ